MDQLKTSNGATSGAIRRVTNKEAYVTNLTYLSSSTAFSQLARRHAASLVVRCCSVGQQIEETYSLLRTAFKHMHLLLWEKQRKEKLSRIITEKLPQE